MDCSTARLFLQFSGADGCDLDGPEAAELDAHLAHCGECQALAQGQRRLDQHLVRAMNAVVVPGDLKARILDRLAQEPILRWKRWRIRAVRFTASAAALLLLAWGYWAYFAAPPTGLPADTVFENVNMIRPGSAEIASQLRQLGVRSHAPGWLNYQHLTGSPSLAILPGTQDWRSPIRVPQMIFTGTRAGEYAVVYIVPRKQYQLSGLETSQEGYKYKLDIERDHRVPFDYIIFHEGKTPGAWRNWLSVPEDD